MGNSNLVWWWLHFGRSWQLHWKVQDKDQEPRKTKYRADWWPCENCWSYSMFDGAKHSFPHYMVILIKIDFTSKYCQGLSWKTFCLPISRRGADLSAKKRSQIRWKKISLLLTLQPQSIHSWKKRGWEKLNNYREWER